MKKILGNLSSISKVPTKEAMHQARTCFFSTNIPSLIRHQIGFKLIADGRQTGGGGTKQQKGTSGGNIIWHQSIKCCSIYNRSLSKKAGASQPGSCLCHVNKITIFFYDNN